MRLNYYSMNHSSEFSRYTNLIKSLHKLTALKFATSFLNPSFPTSSNTYESISSFMLYIPKNTFLSLPYFFVFAFLFLITTHRRTLQMKASRFHNMGLILCMFKVVKLSTWMSLTHINNLL